MKKLILILLAPLIMAGSSPAQSGPDIPNPGALGLFRATPYLSFWSACFLTNNTGASAVNFWLSDTNAYNAFSMMLNSNYVTQTQLTGATNGNNVTATNAVITQAQSQWLLTKGYVGGENWQFEPNQTPWNYNTNNWFFQQFGLPTNAPVIITNGYLDVLRNATNNSTIFYVMATNYSSINFAEVCCLWTSNDFNINYPVYGSVGVPGTTIILSTKPFLNGGANLDTTGPTIHVGFLPGGFTVSCWTNGVGFGGYTNELPTHGFPGGFFHASAQPQTQVDALGGKPSVTNICGVRFVNNNTLQVYMGPDAVVGSCDWFTNFTGGTNLAAPYLPPTVYVTLEQAGTNPNNVTNQLGLGNRWCYCGWGFKPMDDGFAMYSHRQVETNTGYGAFSVWNDMTDEGTLNVGGPLNAPNVSTLGTIMGSTLVLTNNTVDTNAGFPAGVMLALAGLSDAQGSATLSIATKTFSPGIYAYPWQFTKIAQTGNAQYQNSIQLNGPVAPGGGQGLAWTIGTNGVLNLPQGISGNATPTLSGQITIWGGSTNAGNVGTSGNEFVAGTISSPNTASLSITGAAATATTATNLATVTNTWSGYLTGVSANTNFPTFFQVWSTNPAAGALLPMGEYVRSNSAAGGYIYIRSGQSSWSATP